MKITIKDIATKAGVSKSTVSYALSGSRPISEEVRERIAAVIREQNYRPSHAARMMRMDKTMCIGVAVDQCSNPASALFLEELGNLARQHGYHIMLSISGGISGEGRKILEHFASGVVDGIINCMPEISLVEAIRLAGDLPTVTFNRNDPDSPAEPYYLKGIAELLTYLNSLGHRRIGFIAIRQRGMKSGGGNGDPCLLGYRMFCESRQMPVDPALILTGDGSFESGKALGAILYEAGATAIFAGNDRTAAGILAWAHRQGVAVPDRLSVAGWDDSPLASACFPSLTTVQVPHHELARYTLEALLRRFKGMEPLPRQMVDPKLIIRYSTAPLRSDEK